jgi:4a-hydroxytetrahydrobiopterin dehydratase
MATPHQVQVQARVSFLPSLANTRLKPSDIEERLRKLPNWHKSRDSKSLVRIFTFEEEGAPLAFVNFVAVLAGQQGHYPTLTFYKDTVECKLTTPSVGGITLQDFEMARKISLLG